MVSLMTQVGWLMVQMHIDPQPERCCFGTTGRCTTVGAAARVEQRVSVLQVLADGFVHITQVGRGLYIINDVLDDGINIDELLGLGHGGSRP